MDRWLSGCYGQGFDLGLFVYLIVVTSLSLTADDFQVWIFNPDPALDSFGYFYAAEYSCGSVQ